MSDVLESLLSPKEASRVLSLSRSQISRLVASGVLGHYELGRSTRRRKGRIVVARQVRFSNEHIRSFLDARLKEAR